MVPLVFVQNSVDLTISSLTVGEEYIYQDYGDIKRLFELENGTHLSNGKRFHIIHKETLVFCVADTMEFDAPDGKLHKIPITYEFASAYADQLYKLLYDQSQEIINHAHDIQYLVGALLHNSIVIDDRNYTTADLHAKLKKINYVTGIMSAKSAYFQYLTEDTDTMCIEQVSVRDKTYKVHKTVKFLSRSLGKNIHSKFTVYPKGAKGYVNSPDILEFIPFQLVENAIKYAPFDGDIEININDMQDCVLVVVESMGPRIDEDEKKRIFNKGYRGRHGRKFSVKGHGLGLFQAQKAIKELVGGDIWVEQSNHSAFQYQEVDFCETKFFARFQK